MSALPSLSAGVREWERFAVALLAVNDRLRGQVGRLDAENDRLRRLLVACGQPAETAETADQTAGHSGSSVDPDDRKENP